MEHEADPLAIQTSDNRDVEDKKPLLEDLKLFDLRLTQIKTECEDYSCDITSGITPVPNNASMMKYEFKGDSCDLDRVKNELKQEVTTEEDERQFGSCE
ncbi:uncharacterized protein [Periplaneta americana]|uniref:uncharacterized protein isoform X2 n=1 Tax=Periplaneta americana TaxID=6978 RepID=UPI0037E946CB